MKLNEYLSKRSVTRVVVGEYYLIKDFTFEVVDDPFRRGAKKAQVVLETDKGKVWAPSGLANAIWEEEQEKGLESAKEMLHGLIMKGATYYSKNLNKDIVTLEVADSCPDGALNV